MFSVATDSWQRMAEQTITNFSRDVNQTLCPTQLASNKESWTANHQDPAFAELDKAQYVHEMPVKYAPRITHIWQRYFEDGTWPNYRSLSPPGEALPSRCPAAVHL